MSSNEFISCKDMLPPWGILVELKREFQEPRVACLKGWIIKRWIYKSGLPCGKISENDQWRPIVRESKNE